MPQPVRQQSYRYHRGNLNAGTGVRCLPDRPFGYALISVKVTKISRGKFDSSACSYDFDT